MRISYHIGTFLLLFAVLFIFFNIPTAFPQEMARPEKRWVRLRPAAPSQRALADSVGALWQAGDHFDVLYKMNERLQMNDASSLARSPDFDSAIEEIESLLAVGDYEKAMTILSRAEPLAQQSGSKKRQLRTLNLRGALVLGLGRFDEAASIYETMLALAISARDPYAQSVARGNRGNVFHALSKYSQAIAYYDSALVLARSVRDREGEGIWLGNLGYISVMLSQYRQALTHYESALRVARASRDESGVGRCLGNLGSVYQSLGEYPRALAYYDSAAVIARNSDDEISAGIWLGNLGNVYYHLGDYARALEHYEGALKIARLQRDRESEGSWLNGAGNVYYSLVQPRQALAYYDSALVIARRTGDRRAEGLRLGNLGNLYYAIGQYDRALTYLDSALAISREAADREAEGTHLGNLGNVHSKRRDFSRAIDCLQHALLIAREINDRKAEGTWLGDLSTVYYDMGQYPQAIAFADSALTAALEIADAEYIWRSYLSLARSHSRLPSARRNQVIDYYDKAMEALEDVASGLIKDVHKLSFLENKQALYRDYISYLMTQTERLYHEQALEISEASRTRALQDLLQGQRTQAALSVEKRLAAVQRTKALLLTSAGTGVDEIESPGTLRAGAAELLESWAAGLRIPPDTLGSTEGAPAIGMREARAEAKTTTLLEYHVLDDGVVIWILGPNGQFYAHKEPLPQAQLSALIDSARQVLGVAGFGDRNMRPVASGRETRTPAYRPVLQALDSLLIRPVARYLPTDNRELIILPHEVLFLLPFSCLLDSNGKYLAERYSFSIAPSVGLLKFTRSRIREQQDREKPKLLLMGNPEMPDAAIWPALAGAEQEVKLIARRVNEKRGPGFQARGALPLQALPLTKAQATEAEFRQIAGIQNYLHLATHGYVVSDALRCGLILAKTGSTMETDGILTTAEIFGLPLNAELVVLSACQTGLGQISSDGVAGLSRAFLYAGAASLIVSLWQVPDAATQHLMVKFYEELARDGNKARALRAAQLHTMKQYPHPRDWAAFVLVGQPK